MAGLAPARLSKDVSSDVGKVQHVRVALSLKDGELWAEPILGPSGLIRTLVRADGAFIVPAGRAGVNKGETVEVRIF
jgi:molybdopterin molybdotransferase